MCQLPPPSSECSDQSTITWCDDEDCQIKWYANHLGDNFDVENCRAYVTAIEETASAVYQAAHANGSAYDDDDEEEEEEEMEIDWSDSVVGNETEYDDDASGKYEIDWDTGLYKQKDEIEQVDYIPGKDQLEWGDCIPEMIEELQPDEPQPEMTSDDDEIAVVRGWPTESECRSFRKLRRLAALRPQRSVYNMPPRVMPAMGVVKHNVKYVYCPLCKPRPMAVVATKEALRAHLGDLHCITAFGYTCPWPGCSSKLTSNHKHLIQKHFGVSTEV